MNQLRTAIELKKEELITKIITKGFTHPTDPSLHSLTLSELENLHQLLNKSIKHNP